MEHRGDPNHDELEKEFIMANDESAPSDPIFKAIENVKASEQALRALGEDEPHAEAIGVMRAARSVLARTVPTTPAGLTALTAFLVMASDDGMVPYFDEEPDAQAFAGSLHAAIIRHTGRDYPPSIENEIRDVTCASQILFTMLDEVFAGEEKRKDETVEALYWLGGQLLCAVNGLNRKYYGETDKEAAHG
jgi:hypothetical protein